MSRDFENYDEDFGGPGSGRFDNHESPSVDGLKRWKQVGIMLDASSRFRYVVGLKNKEENKQVIPQPAFTKLLEHNPMGPKIVVAGAVVYGLAGYGALKDLKSPTKRKR